MKLTPFFYDIPVFIIAIGILLLWISAAHRVMQSPAQRAMNQRGSVEPLVILRRYDLASCSFVLQRGSYFCISLHIFRLLLRLAHSLAASLLLSTATLHLF